MSNKQNSRSNLYRARKRLHSQLLESGSQNTPPDVWTKPRISGGGERSELEYGIFSVTLEFDQLNPDKSGLPTHGRVRTSLTIRPAPTANLNAVCRLNIGAIVFEDFVSVNESDGRAVAEFDVDSAVIQQDTDGQLNVKWQYGEKTVNVQSKIRDWSTGSVKP